MKEETDNLIQPIPPIYFHHPNLTNLCNYMKLLMPPVHFNGPNLTKKVTQTCFPETQQATEAKASETQVEEAQAGELEMTQNDTD